MVSSETSIHSSSIRCSSISFTLTGSGKERNKDISVRQENEGRRMTLAEPRVVSRQQEFAYATSWGASTRLVGGLIMAHGDERGLRLPPALAPHQAVIVPIFRTNDERARVTALIRHHVIGYSSTWTDAAVRRWIRKVTPELGPDLHELCVAIARTRPDGTTRQIRPCRRCSDPPRPRPDRPPVCESHRLHPANDSRWQNIPRASAQWTASAP